MRICTLAAVSGLALLAAACGDAPEPPRDEPEVRLTLGSPADAAVTRAERIEISGSVKPAGAAVRVLGRDVAVDGGRFSAEVPLEPGSNLIDVAASANGRRPDFAVLRLVREQRVRIPDVVGRDADTAQEQLEGLGLKVGTEDVGGLLDPLLPGDPQVCEMEPAAGEQVLPGADVTLRVARDC